MAPLTGKAKIFVDEYLVDQNATRAAMVAGYSKKSAPVTGHRLLMKANIRAAIQTAMDARAAKVKFTAEEVLVELKNISNADIAQCYKANGDLKSIHEIPLHIRKAIAGVETVIEYAKVDGKKKAVGYTKKLKFWDKTKALELTGRHLKLFTDKLEHTGKDGEPLPQNSPQVIVMLPPKNKDEGNG